MRRPEEKSPSHLTAELAASALDLGGVLIGILQSPGAAFTLGVLAAGGIVAALLMRRFHPQAPLSIR